MFAIKISGGLGHFFLPTLQTPGTSSLDGITLGSLGVSSPEWALALPWSPEALVNVAYKLPLRPCRCVLSSTVFPEALSSGFLGWLWGL